MSIPSKYFHYEDIELSRYLKSVNSEINFFFSKFTNRNIKEKFMDGLVPVTLTPKAVEEVKNIMTNKNIPEGYSLRIGIKGAGGCAGFTYMLGFDQKKDNDLEYKQDGIPVLVQKRETMYLLGLEVDFYEGADARGFTFVKTGENVPQ
ncbi:HesB/IscA family protein [Fulvivirga sediminis]|nr:iron-sulfur cluster assembly accessory protein [Fulvivirga sediminis]